MKQRVPDIANSVQHANTTRWRIHDLIKRSSPSLDAIALTIGISKVRARAQVYHLVNGGLVKRDSTGRYRIV